MYENITLFLLTVSDPFGDHKRNQPYHMLFLETCWNRIKRNRLLIAAIVLLSLVLLVIKFYFIQVLDLL